VPSWTLWAVLGILIWSAVVAFVLVAFRRLSEVDDAEPQAWLDAQSVRAPSVARNGTAMSAEAADLARRIQEPLSVLVVDDDPNLRALLRTSFELAHIQVQEAEGASVASRMIEMQQPDVLVLDVAMPVVDGLDYCRSLKADASTRGIPILLLTGSEVSEETVASVGADAFLSKPFSPLALLSIVERLGEQATLDRPFRSAAKKAEQLLLYAQDFRRLVEIERAQRSLLQEASRDTVVALARALESKDGLTGAHSERVRRYATKLARVVNTSALEEPTLEYGFILHDVGKIGIPDFILKKRDPLTTAERRLLETHTVLGEQMIGDAALLRGEGARVVRSHHERWDGNGYPDGLRGSEIPLGARIFSVADALDAMTSDRPYRRARRWSDAVAEIAVQSGKQFDPEVVTAFQDSEPDLRAVYDALNTSYAFNAN
jgi:response regulator RpfG family c-di-GMP phosphodiesterase